MDKNELALKKKLEKKLERELRRIDKVIQRGDVVLLKYEGEQKPIASYEFVEHSIDAKSLLLWLRGCFVFGMNNRDFSKLSLEHIKAQ